MFSPNSSHRYSTYRSILTGVAILTGLILIISVGTKHLGSSASAQTAGSLTPVVFFDAGLGGSKFGEPVVDSQGRVLITSKGLNVPCGSAGLCEGTQLYSILPTGQQKWQTLADFDSFSDGYGIGQVILGPSDRIYVQGYNTRLSAFEPINGGAISGWPVTAGAPTFWAFNNDKAVLIDKIDGTVFVKTLVFISFRFYNPSKTILAINPDGSQKWIVGFEEAASPVGFSGLIQGPQGDVYTFMGGNFARLDRNTGSQICSLPSPGYSGSFVGGDNALFAPVGSTIYSYGSDCISSAIYTSPLGSIKVLGLEQNIILATDRSNGQTQGNFFAVRGDGTALWRNQQILLDNSANPLRTIKSNIIYVLGQDANDNNLRKLFLVDLLSGQILNSVETTSLCSSCGVAIAGDGAIYINDLNSTKIYKLSSSCATPPSGLVSWWPGSGDANDVVGMNPGTLKNGATATAAGRVGQAFDLSHSLDRVEIPHSPSLTFTTSDEYTVDFWMKAQPHNNAHPALVEKWSEFTNGSYPYVVRLNTGAYGPPGTIFAAAFDGTNTRSVDSSRRVDDNVWHHVAVVFRHSQKRLEVFIDGALDGSSTYATLGSISNSDPVSLGIRPSPSAVREADFEYNGLLDEVSLYNRALSASEIQAVFNAGGAGKCEPIPTPTPNQPPAAGFTLVGGSQTVVEGQTLNITSPTAPVSVHFNADRSSDPDGTVAAWEWKLDGSIVSHDRSFTYDLNHGSHTISLVVSDDKGATSEAVSSEIVIALTDSDGDGLPDEWEINGYHYNGKFIDLPAMGADPDHKDIFVEIDYMKGHRPRQEAIDLVRDSFSRVPNSLFAVPNPDGADGIRLHVHVDEEFAHADDFGSNDSNVYNWDAFQGVKNTHFDSALSLSHHYCLFVHNSSKTNGGPNSGIARGIPSSDFIVSLGAWPSNSLNPFSEGGTTSDQAGTFMHELGHNLGLWHGGFEEVYYKPNYLSVMNYSFQLTGLRKDGRSGLFDYSRFELPPLNELDLNEYVGLNGGGQLAGFGTKWHCPPLIIGGRTDNANGAINWNCNTDLLFRPIFEPAVTADINGDDSLTWLYSYNDWSNLKFKGGTIGAGSVFPLPSETISTELDLDTARSILPPEPSGLEVRFDGCAVRVQWVPTGPVDDYSYRVYRSEAGGPSSLLTTVNGSAYLDTSVDAAKKYYYYVTTLNALGVESGQSQSVIVSDDTPPQLTDVSVDKPVLTPPNHKFVEVTISYYVRDNCEPVSLSLSVVSNEPENGTGDGDTAPDWQILDSHHLRLRAERAGKGQGRVYTITITATDKAGNTIRRVVAVTVPKG